MPFDYDHHCFGCGEKNPVGMKLKFAQEGEVVSTTFCPPATYQGYPGVLHGGIVSTLFDEVMSQCLFVLNQPAFTARLEVRFRHNIPVEKPVRFEAWIVRRKGLLVDLEARALLEDGKLAAEAKGRFMLIKEKENKV
ncbi:MAG TPA: PaaI family thioesterase [Peptococcaceae bacterium]|jgi:acyl-coenzyme A thioesterase PaaI-like protein|nr:PaaI family thioesterase [Clostridia bacterium]HOB82747.1 PaaI family thioesterase [Peptococcaceae bacterium]HPZ71427.1 PaaI family thioesterase [Peptococcaceae bacterium]HQD54520.1 PaaI family thioesterase [Peptococcaceae bacterium]